MPYTSKIDEASLCTREIICGVLESVSLFSEHYGECSVIFTVSGKDVLVTGGRAKYYKHRFSYLIKKSLIMVCTRVDLGGISRYSCRYASVFFIGNAVEK